MFAWITVKDYVYGVLIAIVVSGSIWFVHHERAVGEHKIEAADKAYADKVIAANVEKKNEISKAIADAEAKWKTTNPPATPAPIPSIVCHSSVSGGVPKGPASSGGSHEAGTVVPISPKQSDGSFDPAPRISAIGQDADTEITRLKAKVTLLQDTIEAYQNGGLVDKR